MSRKEVLRVSHFSNSSCESLLIFCTMGSKVQGTVQQCLTATGDEGAPGKVSPQLVAELASGWFPSMDTGLLAHCSTVLFHLGSEIYI